MDGKEYRIYQDRKGNWIIQNTFTDVIVNFNFKTKREALSHAERLSK